MKNVYILLLIGFLQPVWLSAQTNKVGFRIMWYNAENLFDTENDPEKNDDEFLPDGNRRWTPKRYYQKLQQIAKVIIAAGEWDMPALVGMCEVENDSVITHLLHRTPLRHHLYRYCITSGSDTRGINIALLYRRDLFDCIGNTSYPVRYTDGKQKPTRDILHVWGETTTRDTLDLFLCHFPSRSGGEKETETYRIDAAHTLRMLCDSVYGIRRNARIILMGDFNDMPQYKSIAIIEGEQPHYTNLFGSPGRFSPPGSYKYQGKWNQLDQIFVSPLLSDTTRSIHLTPESPRIFAPGFLLVPDKTHRGVRPFRSFYGFRYEGGFSDHLPLLIDLRINE